ncbi:hypothetical protein M0805_006515 [Coniferiporia weirii]|nr:hypothetical protein M0805_006515 [Coniferiporia weirii]
MAFLPPSPSPCLTPSSTSPTTSTAPTQRKHHLANLYELVQYAGNIIPHLYLMIMRSWCGVQHLTHGLFLHHYLSRQMWDNLPVGDIEGLVGNLQDSIAFELTNFIKMNKL